MEMEARGAQGGEEEEVEEGFTGTCSSTTAREVRTVGGENIITVNMRISTTQLLNIMRRVMLMFMHRAPTASSSSLTVFTTLTSRRSMMFTASLFITARGSRVYTRSTPHTGNMPRTGSIMHNSIISITPTRRSMEVGMVGTIMIEEEVIMGAEGSKIRIVRGISH